MSVFQPVAAIIYALHYMHSMYEIANVIFYIVAQMLNALVYSHMNNVRSIYSAKKSKTKQATKKPSTQCLMLIGDGDGEREKERRKR